MKTKNISCIVLNYNDPEHTIKLIKEIYTYKNIDNIVIVDNKSTDNSLEILRPCENEKITVISSDCNGGYGYGNNFGIRYSKNKLNSTHAIVANPDVVFSEEVVDDCLKAFDLNNNVCLSTCLQKDRYDDLINLLAWSLPSKKNLIFANEYLFRHTFFKRKGVNVFGEDYMFVDCIPGSFFVVDIDKFLEIGGYNERMFLYNEENWLGYKFKEKGYLTVLITKKVYRHEHSVSIDKSIPSVSRQRKQLYNSTIVVLEDVFNVKSFEKFLIKGFFRLCYFEELIINFIKYRS